jgi:HEAT repeat protein
MNDPRATQKLSEAARSADSPELRRGAIKWLAERDTDAVADELIRLYDADGSGDVRMQILHSLSEMKSPRARARLTEVARSGADTELRGAAIRWLVDGGDSQQTVETLVGLYDAERDAQVKASILRALGESHQKSALRKLMDVARRDASLDLRKMAIRQIGESKDPEALKFLEELLKQ